MRWLGAHRIDRLVRFLAESRPQVGGRAEIQLRENVATGLGLLCESERVFEILRASRLHYARFWGELPFLLSKSRLSPDRDFIDNAAITNDRLASAETRGGAIFTSACLGNPVAAALAVLRARGTLAVVADFDYFPVARIWQHYWSRIDGLRMLNRSAALRELPGILGNGGAVFMLADHFRQRGAGPPVSWLGQRQTAYRTLGVLACQHGVPIIPVTALRQEAAMQFNLNVHDPVLGADEPEGVVRQTLSKLETDVRLQPEQYLWSGVAQSNQ